jgi:thiosulfate/3-mercaptopyruvate sulfurtransferase
VTKKKVNHTLITVQDFVSLWEEPNTVILDCRYSLADASMGRKAYMENHIPGAYYMDIAQDLSSSVRKGITGRHPLPHPEILSSSLRAAGLHGESQVVVYDQSNGAYAARAWWLLQWLGHEKAAVLEGGYAAWLSRDLPVDNAWTAPKSGDFQPVLRQELIVNVHEVADLRENVIDSREYKRFTGETEPIDPIAGHIPGAVCIPYMDNTDEHGFWKSQEELQKKFENIHAAQPPRPVFYCGSGVTACHNILAYKIATGEDAILYPGSWSEWILHYPPAVGP